MIKKSVLTILQRVLMEDRRTALLATVLRNSLIRTSRFFLLASRGFDSAPSELPLRKFGDEKHQVFFGYYDISPFSYDDAIILGMRAPCRNIQPTSNTALEIGFYETTDNCSEFNLVGTTTTWCWQQGCRLQWYPPRDQGRGGNILYNTMVGDRYGSIIQDIRTKRIVEAYECPIYSVSPDGKWGLSLDFSRLHRMRPGYGYVNLPDRTQRDAAPESDGIWRLNMHTGEKELLFSVADIADYEALDTMGHAEHYLNHILFSPNGSRFLFMHLCIANSSRFSRLITCDTSGTDLYVLVDGGHASHYTWKSNDHILCYSSQFDLGTHYFLYTDKSSSKAIVAEGLLCSDGHPSYSHNGMYLLTDTYPTRLREQHVMLLNLVDGKLANIGRFFSPIEYQGALRCDLHPRWSPSGRYVCIDSAHEGKRALYILDLFPLTSSS